MEALLKSQEIEIYMNDQAFLGLNDMIIFPHGKDGLHLWEAGIILARYIFYHPELFQNKSVLELGSGVGIGGIALKLFSEAKQVILSDYKEEIVANIVKQVQKNKIQSKDVEVIQLDWVEYQKYQEKHDVIIGSDLLYNGTPFTDLYNLVHQCLNLNGIFIIIIPSQREFSKQFIDLVDQKQEFKYSVEKLEDPKYFVSPLKNQTEGKKMYPGLVELSFFVYTFEKIK